MGRNGFLIMDREAPNEIGAERTETQKRRQRLDIYMEFGHALDTDKDVHLFTLGQCEADT